MGFPPSAFAAAIACVQRLDMPRFHRETARRRRRASTRRPRRNRMAALRDASLYMCSRTCCRLPAGVHAGGVMGRGDAGTSRWLTRASRCTQRCCRRNEGEGCGAPSPPTVAPACRPLLCQLLCQLPCSTASRSSSLRTATVRMGRGFPWRIGHRVGVGVGRRERCGATRGSGEGSRERWRKKQTAAEAAVGPGAEGGTRTHTLLRAADFESAASTDSATSARPRSIADRPRLRQG